MHALIFSQVELARIVGQSRQSVSAALKGPLASARAGSHRIDAAHPTAQKWLADRGVEPNTVGLRRWTFGEPHEDPDEEERRKAQKLVAESYVVTRADFARIAGVTPGAITHAAERGALKDACVGPHILLNSMGAFEYLARHPFRRDEQGQILEEEVPDGYLGTAVVGDMIDLEHPMAVAFFCRCEARLPTIEELDNLARGGHPVRC